MEAPYIVWRGRFLGEKSAGMLTTDVGMAVATFLPKLRGAVTHLGPADPWVGPLSTAFAWESCRWVHVLIFCVSYFCTSAWSVLWALIVSITQDGVFCAFLLRLVLVFFLFRIWVPANQKSPKLVELIRIKSYNYFW